MQNVSPAHIPGMHEMMALPTILRAVLSGITGKESSWKPSPQRWCILEVLGHLCHVESHSFRPRIEIMLKETDPEFPDYDPSVYEAASLFNRADLTAALDEFEQERARSLELLRTIPSSALTRTGRHSALGTVTMGQLLHHFAMHDLGHLRQIIELIRAVKFYPGVGPWVRYDKVSP
jgi:uncharacterized damage-inducible protein DinB